MEEEKQMKKEKEYNIKYTKEELAQEVRELQESEELQFWFRLQDKLNKYNQYVDILNKIE